VAAAGETLFLVEDDEGLYRLRRGRCRLWAGAALHPALGDLEGAAIDARGRRLWAVAEETGTVVALDPRARKPEPMLLGCLARPGTRRNKGYEGLAFLPAAHSPNGRASLAAAHESKPRRVRVFALPDLVLTHELRLARDVRDALADLADLTVDPVTGVLLLLSEESRRIGVCRIDDGELRLESTSDIHVTRDERPEGLDFATPSRLIVVTEGPAMVIHFRVTRR
jgi:uncharacterized protein YjiK